VNVITIGLSSPIVISAVNVAVVLVLVVTAVAPIVPLTNGSVLKVILVPVAPLFAVTLNMYVVSAVNPVKLTVTVSSFVAVAVLVFVPSVNVITIGLSSPIVISAVNVAVVLVLVVTAVAPIFPSTFAAVVTVSPLPSTSFEVPIGSLFFVFSNIVI
jgi:hypothetical protein